jgi:hypothetical protein
MELDGASGGLSLKVGGNISESERRHFRVESRNVVNLKDLNMFGDRVISHAD